ncbi:hypothetical protein F5I97DRAFT_1925874 [Phlebopus sp. FC_14]|nr:hypothetical protein F5I97DRAFT_1925874 [Phlebopus sp. FC_14]
MHHALIIVEIQRIICGYLDPWVDDHRGDRVESSKSLAALAVTCRAFSDAALDALWCTQESLGPLLLCLPPKLVRSVRQLGRKEISLTATPTNDDWTWVATYARRIRNLNLNNIGDKNRTVDPLFRFMVDTDAFEKLQKMDILATLLPSLQNLGYGLIYPPWVSRPPEGALCAEFLVRGLREFKIMACGEYLDQSGLFNEYLGAISTNCPDLQSLAMAEQKWRKNGLAYHY